MWVLKEISPSAFNVLSDLTGQAVSGILLFVLAAVYPYLIWEAVKHGSGVALDGIISPPNSLLDAVTRLRDGGSRWLLSGTVLIMLVATLSHTASDIFLEFVTVGVGFNETFFLGTQPGDLPIYELLGERKPNVEYYPATPAARLICEADSIAKGLSRLSIVPPGLINITSGGALLSGLVRVERSDLHLAVYGEEKIRPFPGNLQVECQSPSENIVSEVVIVAYEETVETAVERERAIPNCDYESPVSYETIEKEVDIVGWKVLDWTYFTIPKGDDYGRFYPFGARDSAGRDFPWIEFPLNETELSISRDDWRLGRRVRDGISLMIGLVVGGNDTMGWFDEHSEGVEFRVEYSVLSGPSIILDEPRYTLSSWSRSCPVIDPSGNLLVATFPLEGARTELSDLQASASGCLIDAHLTCDTIFPSDNATKGEVNETPWCFLGGYSVTLLRGIEVDRMMLAAYAGTATRNDGINTEKFYSHHSFSLNSIAAAYIMTREIVHGTVAVEGVRASIGPAYICLLLLPLLFVFPLLSFKKRGQTPPVPHTIWDVLVLGRGEEVVPKRLGSDSAYPHRPDSIKFGITSGGNKGFDHLGLGYSFVPLERPLSERDEETSVEQLPLPNNMPSPLPSMDAEIIVEQPLPINTLSPTKTKRASPPYFSMDSSDS